MRRLITLFFLVFTLSGVAFAQQMSDDQVVQYVKSAQQMGKNQKQITTELMRRGVTKEQVERIQKKYENSKSGSPQSNTQDEKRSRQRGEMSGVVKGLRTTSETYSARQTDVAGESLQMMDNRSLSQKKETEDPTSQIYGHNIFTNDNLTFEPNVNVATPENYRLGPGDEVIIDVWGASETTIRQTISPEGSILVNNLGPVYLSGKTVKEANNYLKQEFARIYSGVTGNVPSTQVKLTLGEIRSIQVNVMGEVVVPGTYTLSSLLPYFMLYIVQVV